MTERRNKMEKMDIEEMAGSVNADVEWEVKDVKKRVMAAMRVVTKNSQGMGGGKHNYPVQKLGG
jgi:hypothetical protein